MITKFNNATEEYQEIGDKEDFDNSRKVFDILYDIQDERIHNLRAAIRRNGGNTEGIIQPINLKSANVSTDNNNNNSTTKDLADNSAREICTYCGLRHSVLYCPTLGLAL